ncbi:hypothetical protein ABFY60_23530 [Lysinibacillus pakistanensis]|uniref:hypothetical protein n=1 Tax=Lysinibacillus pakistanensis TaxID=759811 RepID=UPI003D29C5E0
MTYYDDIALPKKYLIKHNFCLHLHDVILSVFFECMEDETLKGIEIREENIKDLEVFSEDSNTDLIKWLYNNAYENEANILLKRRIFHAMLADFLSYVLEALKAAEKGKTAIAYTLLRKPFKDNLLYFEWLLIRGNELLSYVDNGEIENYEVGSVRRKQRAKMKLILSKSMERNPFLDLFEPVDKDFMYNLRYNYNSPYSLELMWNNANHLVTTAKPIRTKDFNNVFLTEEDFDNHLDYFYSKLPFLLLYSMGVILNLYEMLFEKISDESKFYNNILIKSKWISILDQDKGKELLVGILKKLDALPIYCEGCGELTEISEKDLDRVLFSWFVDCQKCNEPIPISRYFFL